MGVILTDLDKLEEAIKAYSNALSLKSDYAEAHRNLSSLKKYTEADAQFLQVQEYYDQEDMSDDDKCHLSFALAKMYEDIGDMDKSFACLNFNNFSASNRRISIGKFCFSSYSRITCLHIPQGATGLLTSKSSAVVVIAIFFILRSG